jgi:PAS domain S-box-containing protein
MMRQSFGGWPRLEWPFRFRKGQFFLIVLTIAGLQLVALLLGWASVELIDGTRAYATGEGLYSKAQKLAALSLHRYADTGDERYYQAFQAYLRTPVGDREAREALENGTPDQQAAIAGFLRGGNHPEDVAGLARLFVWMHWWDPFATAVADWRAGDALVARLARLGAVVHELNRNDPDQMAARVMVLREVEVTDDSLTALETAFSRHMGEAARAAKRLVVGGLGLSSFLLWTVGIAFAWRIFRRGMRTDAELAVSERRFRDIAEVSSDWFWEADASMQFTYLSERFAEVTGVRPELVIGRTALDLMQPLGTDDAHRRHLRGLRSREPFRGMIYRYALVDGREQYWRLSGTPIVGAAGRFLGYRGTGSNVTHEIVDQSALLSAKEKAELSSQAKTSFLANMSHELRTPLNAILGFSEIIKDRLLGPDAQDRYAEYAGDIFASGNHLLDLISDILDLSKIEAGKLELYEALVDVRLLVGATVRLLRQRAKQAGLRLVIDAPDDLPLLFADERKLKQVLTNLLANAIKFTRRGGMISVSVTAANANGLVISVVDTGIGIAAEDIPRAFEIFGQIDSNLSRHHPGTGLGLPLARSLIELHGGTLKLTSKVGAGTTVTIVLPSRRLQARPAIATVASALDAAPALVKSS